MKVLFYSNGNMRGSHMDMSIGSSHGASGAYLSVAGGGTEGGAIPSSQGLFVTGISASFKEKYGIVSCFGDRNYIYAFGSDPGNTVSVDFTALVIGPNCKNIGDSIRQLYGRYTHHMRISANESPIATVTLGSVSFSGYVVGMSLSTADSERGVITGSVHLIVPRLEVV